MKDLHLITAKPVLYIANVSEDGFENNPHLDAVREYAAGRGPKWSQSVPPSKPTSPSWMLTKRPSFCRKWVSKSPASIASSTPVTSCSTANLFHRGPQEVRAWTIRVGDTAPRAAGKIHTDFEKGFIRAEVVGFDDFIAGNGEQGAKDAGKWRLEGKDYVMQEADVVHFRFNV